jgi:sugar/nucleoside kinase (ribokinase family)
MYPIRNNHWPRLRVGQKTRLCIGGICRDNFLSVAFLVWHGKNPIRSRASSGGGGAANNAVGHRRLAPESPIVLLANVGDDADGHALRRHMAELRIDMPLPPLAGVPTSVSFAIVEQASGNGTVLYDLGARAEPIPLHYVKQALPGAEACCLVSPAVNEQIAPILELAAAHDVPLYFGLGSAQIDSLGYDGLEAALVKDVELLICNRAEARKLTGREDLADQLDALRFAGRVRTVVITDGPAGLHAVRDGERCDVPAYRDGRPVVDDVGAGDAAQAALVDALLRRYPLELTLLAGARQGYEACTAFGATTHLLDAAPMRDYLSLAAGAGVG